MELPLLVFAAVGVTERERLSAIDDDDITSLSVLVIIILLLLLLSFIVLDGVVVTFVGVRLPPVAGEAAVGVVARLPASDPLSE